MSEWSPESLWERVRRTFEGWMEPEDEVDEASLAFHLAFIAPLLLAFALALRR